MERFPRKALQRYRQFGRDPTRLEPFITHREYFSVHKLGGRGGSQQELGTSDNYQLPQGVWAIGPVVCDFAGRGRIRRGTYTDPAVEFVQYHYVVRVATQKLAQFKRMRRALFGCRACIWKSYGLCKQCHASMSYRPPNDDQHLNNIIKYILRKVDGEGESVESVSGSSSNGGDYLSGVAGPSEVAQVFNGYDRLGRRLSKERMDVHAEFLGLV